MAHGAWGRPGSICELVLIGHGSGSLQIVNVHAFEASTVEEATFLTDTIRDNSAIALREDWITNLKALWLAMHNSTGDRYTLDTVGSQIVEKPGSVSFRLGRQDHTLTSANTGTMGSSGEPFPAEVAAVIRWKSLIASRHARGRTFVAPLDQTAGQNGVLEAAGVAALDAYATALRARYNPTGTHNAWNLTVYSRPYDAPHGNYVKRVGGALTVIVKPDYNGDSNFVTAHSVDPVLRTQRRRQVGVGA